MALRPRRDPIWICAPIMDAPFDARIRLAADLTCDRIDGIDHPMGEGRWISDRGDCRHLAVKSAELDKRAAIRAAG